MVLVQVSELIYGGKIKGVIFLGDYLLFAPQLSAYFLTIKVPHSPITEVIYF